jgi:two-component system chemotaxis response regulator CheB
MPFFIIVIGASAGGRDVLCKLAAALPGELNAAVFIVSHLAKEGIDTFLANRLQKCTPLHCRLAAEGLPIETGHIYVAPVGVHLVLKPGTMHLTKGPAENRWRPSIDVLFRTAAVHYNELVIGIILTGMLNDGTAGMQAIQRCGGTCIVQDPREAEYPGMPQSVLDNTMVDFILPVATMSEAIIETINNKDLTGVKVPEELKAEAVLAEKTVTAIDVTDKLGKQTVFTCPDCGGGLWEIKQGGFTRYRCHIGHAYSEDELLSKQFDSLNASLWVALRMMEERKTLLKKISEDEKIKNLHVLANMHTAQASELEVHINNLKEFIFNVKPN